MYDSDQHRDPAFKNGPEWLQRFISLGWKWPDPDLSALLFDWLTEIVYLKDAKGLVFCEATAAVTHDPAKNEWRLQSNVIGEPIDQTRHELRADIKAVTKHLYEVRQVGTRWMARVVLDI